MSKIFQEHARRLRELGLPVMPVIGKAAVIKGWSEFCERMPTDEEFAVWEKQYAFSNIGLPLGPASGLVAIDVDTEVEHYHTVIMDTLPDSPWVRVGSKGFVILYRYNGETKQQLFEKNDLQGNRAMVELLTLGQQVVLPPSIHPKTHMPYVANCPLESVLDKLGTLPRDFMEQLMAAFKKAGVETSMSSSSTTVKFKKLSSLISAGNRDNAITAFAGELAVEVRKGERTLADALALLEIWSKNQVERRQGDDIDPNKGMNNLVRFLKKDIAGGKPIAQGWDEGLDPEVKRAFGLESLDDGMVTRNIASVVAEFQESFEGGTALAEVITNLIENLATSVAPGSLDEHHALQNALLVGRGTYTMASLRRALKQRRDVLAAEEGAPEDEGENHTQTVMAMLRVMDAVEVAPYGDASLWDFDGSRWIKYDHERLAIEISQRFAGGKFSNRFSDFKQIAALTLATAQSQINDGARPWFERETMIPFKNGVLTEDLRLEGHHRRFGAYYTFDCDYEPEATCPMWLGMLYEYWGADTDYAEKVQALREAMAASLFGIATRFERCFFLCGEGKNGKSTILKILEGLFPPMLVSSVSAEDFGSRFGAVSLDGKLLNIAQEVRDNYPLDDKRLKEIVSGNLMEVEQKGLPRYKIKPVAAHWFGTNNIPRVDETSNGLLRRLLMFEFKREVQKVIPGLDKKVLKEEKAGIIAWAVQAIRGLQEDYTLPASHKRLMKAFIARNNSTLAWLEASLDHGRLVIGGDAFIDARLAYNIYTMWCRMSATHPGRVDRFKRDMERAAGSLKFEIVDADVAKKQEPGFRGLKLVG